MIRDADGIIRVYCPGHQVRMGLRIRADLHQIARVLPDGTLDVLGPMSVDTRKGYTLLVCECGQSHKIVRSP